MPRRYAGRHETDRPSEGWRRRDNISAMKDTLAVGIAAEKEHAVTDDMAPPHLPVKVLSTPSMIQLIEGTCLMLAQEHLDEGEVTVGTHVCVSHRGAAMSGETVKVKTELTGLEKRRLTFTITVT